MKINPVYEDNHIIVVIKQPNIPVQADESMDLDMLTMMKAYLKEKYNKPGNVYLGLVHRLDRPVGGVMVFAKTSKAASRLSNQFRENMVDKTYLALVHGKLEKNKGTLNNYLLKDKETFISKVVSKEIGKKATLEYDVITYDQDRDLSLLKIKLHTGRHHQIRVQLSHINHSIYGDQRYGNDKVGIQIHLWASHLSFKHPTRDEILSFDNIPSWAEPYLENTLSNYVER
ncbi:MAG: RluA family pseudouridine synthase [Bacilli bacterium]|nr:RluA family pseudouridine synthase [Bacilli bacterium]